MCCCCCSALRAIASQSCVSWIGYERIEKAKKKAKKKREKEAKRKKKTRNEMKRSVKMKWVGAHQGWLLLLLLLVVGFLGGKRRRRRWGVAPAKERERRAISSSSLSLSRLCCVCVGLWLVGPQGADDRAAIVALPENGLERNLPVLSLSLSLHST